jgi:hypothetical protein
MRRLRELYITGIPPWIVAQSFGVTNGALRSHAWRHNWHRRRSYNLPDPKYLLTMLALARLRDTWHLADGNSADRMLALLPKLLTVEEQKTRAGKSKLKWEEQLRQARQQLEAKEA